MAVAAAMAAMPVAAGAAGSLMTVPALQYNNQQLQLPATLA